MVNTENKRSPLTGAAQSLTLTGILAIIAGLLATGVALAFDVVECAVCSEPAINPGCGTSVSGTCATGGCGNSQNVCAYKWLSQPIQSCYDAPGQGQDCLQDQTQQQTCSIGVPEERCRADGSCDTPSPFCTTITLTLPGCTGNQIDRNCKGS